MNLDVCREILHSENLTCVAADESGILLKSGKKGILPMLDVLDLYQNQNGRPVYQADRIIGKAAIIIAAHCGIREIYADVISDSAWGIALYKGIKVIYRDKVEMILDRTGTREGPFEAALHDVDTDDFGLVMKTIYETLDSMGIPYGKQS